MTNNDEFDIDEMLYQDEHSKFEINISDNTLCIAQNKIKKLNEIGAINVHVVTNKDSATKFYLYCKRYKLPYAAGNTKTLMSSEQYLLFNLTGLKHTAKFFKELTNKEILKIGVLYDVSAKL